MPLYKYDSFNRRGGRILGTIDAGSLQAAKELLRGQGLMPVALSEVSSERAGFSLAKFFEAGVDVKSKINFTKQLGVLLRSGVPLLQAIELLSEQFEGQLHRILLDVKDNIKAGEPFASSLAKYPRVFSHVYVQLVKAGEASGKLESILERLTTYLERADEMSKKISKAMSGPLMQLGMVGLVVVGVLTFLIPRFKEMFAESNSDLPLPTAILIFLSDALVNYWVFVLVGVIVIGIGFSYWKSTPQGKYAIDSLMLKLPIISYFSKIKAVVQCSKTLGMLLESGVNLSEALDIVCNIVDNGVLTTKLKEARDKIIKEGRIAKYLKETGIFPNIASYMISTGENSGKLAQMLLTVGDDYDAELSERSEGLSDMVSPIMQIVLMVIVAFIIAAIFLPMMKMGQIAGA
jgi:type II secretory pathway component PulF